MKLEIDLDLNQIDYEAINKQVQEKIAQMDLRNEYRIETRIDQQIRDDVEREVRTYLKSGGWYGELNDRSKQEIKDEISKKLRELLAPCVENTFSKITREELDEVVKKFLPEIFMDMLTSDMRSMLEGYYYRAHAEIIGECHNMFDSMLRR